MTTKTTIKKVVAKKTVTKKTPSAITFVTRVPGELAFWTVDGQAFHTLEELAEGLMSMAGRVYRYHADKDHQDFASWVGTVFHNKALAKELKTAATAKATAKIIRTSSTVRKV